MICRLCGEECKLIDSHIIPKWVFRYLHSIDNKNKPLILLGEKENVSEKSWNGPYEKLLCEKCDNALGVYDGYAKNVFVEAKLAEAPGLQNIAWCLEGVDVTKIKLFALSLLWRMSISSHFMFLKVDLGPHESKLRDILSFYEKGFGYFDVFITKYIYGQFGEMASKVILDPIKFKIDGINFVRIFLPNTYELFIKVDKRALPSFFEPMKLGDSKNAFVINRGEYDRSDSFNKLIEIARKHPKEISKFNSC